MSEYFFHLSKYNAKLEQRRIEGKKADNTKSVLQLLSAENRHCFPRVLGSGHSKILKNMKKFPKKARISLLIGQFSCKNFPIKDGGC